MQIVIGSLNPIKIQASMEAYREIGNGKVEFLQHSPDISVSNTPSSIVEMIKGAQERASQSLGEYSACDYGLGIEGGLFKIEETYFLTAYAVTMARNGNIGIGGSPVLQLPDSWEIQDDLTFELGTYVDSIAKRENIKQQEGAMGILTNNRLPRKDSLKYAVLCSYYALKNAYLQR